MQIIWTFPRDTNGHICYGEISMYMYVWHENSIEMYGGDTSRGHSVRIPRSGHCSTLRFSHCSSPCVPIRDGICVMSWDPTKGLDVSCLEAYWLSHVPITEIILNDYLLLAQYLHSKLARKLITCFSTVVLGWDIPPHEIYITVRSTKNGHVGITKWTYFHKGYNRFNTYGFVWLLWEVLYTLKFSTIDSLENSPQTSSSPHTLAWYLYIYYLFIQVVEADL